MRTGPWDNMRGSVHQIAGQHVDVLAPGSDSRGGCGYGSGATICALEGVADAVRHTWGKAKAGSIPGWWRLSTTLISHRSSFAKNTAGGASREIFDFEHRLSNLNNLSFLNQVSGSSFKELYGVLTATRLLVVTRKSMLIGRIKCRSCCKTRVRRFAVELVHELRTKVETAAKNP